MKLERRSFLTTFWMAILLVCGKRPTYASVVVDNTPPCPWSSFAYVDKSGAVIKKSLDFPIVECGMWPDNLFYMDGALVRRTPGMSMFHGNSFYNKSKEPNALHRHTFSSYTGNVS
jgi:hypothetical protein